MNSIIRIRVVAAAVTALMGGLALTACSANAAAPTAHASDTGSAVTAAPPASDASGKAAAASSVHSAPGDGSGNGNAGTGIGIGTRTDSTTSRNGASGGGGSVRKASGSGSGRESTSPKPCTEANLHLTAQLVNEPLNHLLITATNTGTARCEADNAPLVGFDGDQAVAQIDQDSVPQAVVSLDPGQSAFASMTLSAGDGSGTHGRSVKSLRVFFVDRDNQSVGSGTEVPLPSGTFKDDSARVTFWQSTQELALSR